MRRPRAILELVRSRALRFTDGNAVALYDTGRAGLLAMLEAIEAARERVHLETYILRSDGIGRQFLATLEERARSGVDVRVLYDAIGSRGLDDEALAPLRRAGGEVVAFNPLVRFPPRLALRRRDHRKILVVDGCVAFTGGLNIGDEYASGLERGDPGWIDAHLRVEGPAVRDLEAVFLESWFRADGSDLSWHALLGTEPKPAGDVRCAVLPDGPAYRRRRARDVILTALESAEADVAFESPYFAPGRRVLEGMAAAGQRGVRVELVLAGKTDHPLLRRAARSNLPRLLHCGVRVFEYHQAMMHAKVAVFDDQWAMVGTSNLDRQSFRHNYEVNLIVEGGELPVQLRERIERDRDLSREIDEASLAARGPIERAIDRIAALLLFAL